MTKTILLGATLAVLFTVSMLTSTIWANGDGLSITKASFDEFSMQTDGVPGQTTDGHDIVVFRFYGEPFWEGVHSWPVFFEAHVESVARDVEFESALVVGFGF